MAEIETTGRGARTRTYGDNDLEAFFAKSGVLEDQYLTHTPFLVFQDVGDRIVVKVVHSALTLVTDYPPETKVMVQWAGRWRSDYFQMTAGDVRAELERRGVVKVQYAERVEFCGAPPDNLADRPGRCTDCHRRTGGEEIGNPCRMPLLRGGHCRGRIVKPVTRDT